MGVGSRDTQFVGMNLNNNIMFIEANDEVEVNLEHMKISRKALI